MKREKKKYVEKCHVNSVLVAFFSLWITTEEDKA